MNRTNYITCALFTILLSTGCLSVSAKGSNCSRWLITATNGSGDQRAKIMHKKAAKVCPDGFTITSDITTTTATAAMYIECKAK